MTRWPQLFFALLIAAAASAQTDTATFRYEERLSDVLDFHSCGIAVIPGSPDTIAQQVSLDIRFHFSKRALAKMVRDFRSDTTLPAIPGTSLAVQNGSALQLGRITLEWSPRLHGFLSKGRIPLLAIDGKKINREVDGYVLMERKKSGNVMTIYLENGTGGWYSFVYANGILLAYSSQETFNTIVARQPHWKRNRHARCSGVAYRYTLGSVNERALLMKKVQRARGT
jgi:hypothetical protein